MVTMTRLDQALRLLDLAQEAERRVAAGGKGSRWAKFGCLLDAARAGRAEAQRLAAEHWTTAGATP